VPHIFHSKTDCNIVIEGEWPTFPRGGHMRQAPNRGILIWELSMGAPTGCF
jgi:hypothetical protein